ncbi:MAG TPA: carboxypeptidase regulatory-like domain-containing protein [Bryobacteraceae bacterium]|nr:carboxypeptidase regulatory-like domain-containing protein [Bryobacteraceae bacterium]
MKTVALHKFWKPAMLGAAMAMLWATIGPAQSTSGNIAGTIYDQSGATVPNASVSALNTGTGVTKATVATSSGQYRVPDLPVGTYTLHVSAPGFATAEVTNVSVVLNQTVTSNVTIQVQKTSTSVEVSTAAPAIDTTTAQVQTTFESRQSEDLSMAAGTSGVINLSLLNAGVASSGGIGYGVGPSVGGQRPTNNNFTIEGIDDNQKSTTGPIVTVPNDAVAEFTVLQNQFSPDFGHSSGGQFNQVVKSGTNQFHGILYEYFQNKNLNAADNLNYVSGNALHPRFDNNRFGGTLGGPIKRNKMFFFVDWEYNTIGQALSTYYYVPTNAAYATLAAMPGINQTNLAELKKYLGVAPAASSPATLPFGGPVTVGPGNESLGTQTTAAVTIPVGQVAGVLPNWENVDSGVASYDYSISDKDSLRARYVFNRIGLLDYQGFPSEFFDVRPTHNYLATVSEYHTFSPTLTNEFRLGYNRYADFIPVKDQSFPGLDAFPNISIYELNIALGPDPNAPQFTIQNTYQLTDNLSWTRGNHSLKFGFDGWKSISPSSFTQRGRGDYEWSFLSDYLFDNNPDGIAQRGLGDVVYYGDQVLLGFFGNDVWKIRPNLTLNLGLRYEYQTVPYSERSQVENIAASVPGLIRFGVPQPQTTNFMPRIGLAYSPGTSGTTSIRAGFGINYDVLYDNLGTLSLPPQFQTTVDVTGQDKSGFLANGGIPPNASVGALTVQEARLQTQGFIPDQKRPESIQWNLGVQHVFGNNYTFETRYVGNRGLFLPVQVQLNRQPVVNAQNALPVFFGTPSQATLNSLTNTLGTLQSAFNAGGYIVPAYAAAGFSNPNTPITAFMPIGNSTYHGLANSLTRRFSNGLQFLGAYTWSHAIDDSTATVASTVFTPRRPQDSQNMSTERASSALDHRQRLSFEMIYDMPLWKNRNWFLRNLVGNWEVAPIYIYQTGTLITPQSETDSNLNADSAPDRVFINPAGNPGLGSGVQALTNSAGQTVAYAATNPNARYVSAPQGTLPSGGRSLIALNPINDVDLTLAKRIDITERWKAQFAIRVFNVFNHPQYTGGFLDDTTFTEYSPNSVAGQLARTSFDPKSSVFQQWDQVFSSNPRSVTLSLKLIF